MLVIAGAGDIAGALAQRAASRQRFREIRLIDETGSAAAGKALDLRQAGPVDGYDTRVTGHASFDAASGARVVAIADRFGGAEWEGDAGLAMLSTLLPLIGDAPLVFAGARQLWLMEAAHRELKIPAWRMAGSSPIALEGALRALAALAIDRSANDVHLRIAGRPPEQIVINWSSGTAAGAPLESVLPSHERFAISERAKGLWPPGPAAMASAAARVAEAFAEGTRRDYTCMVLGDRDVLPRGMAAAMPVEIQRGRIARVKRPALSPREQGQFDNAVRT
jgi:malate dehydrogenase